MSLIIVKLDKFTRPLVAPLDAAAYAVFKSKSEPDKARIVFRMKMQSEANALVSLNNVKKEIVGVDWIPVEAIPGAQNIGGVSADDSPYRVIDCRKVGDTWRLEGDIDAYLSSINKTNVTGASLPEASKATKSQLTELGKDIALAATISLAKKAAIMATAALLDEGKVQKA